MHIFETSPAYNCLTDEIILSIVLKNKIIAKRLLKKMKLRDIFQRPQELLRIKGLTPSHVDQLLAIKDIATRIVTPRIKKGEMLSGSTQVFGHYNERFLSEKQEHLYAILLDSKHRVTKEVLISKGTLDQSIVHPRDVFASAIEARAESIILIHNHPSGVPMPSKEDTAITERLIAGGKLIGINILDHIIIGHDSYYSFLEEWPDKFKGV